MFSSQPAMVLYQEYPPCAALAPYLACLWTCHVHTTEGALIHRVLPDNCIDILWQDRDPLGGVAGMMSTAIAVPFTRPVRTVAARFRPGAASHFFDLPLHELIDLHPALDDLWERGAAARFADALWTHPLSDTAAVGVVQQLLLQRLQGACRQPGVVEAAVQAIERSGGSVRIETLAGTLGVTRQHLSGQFRSRVGLPAKTFARICRFQRASTLIREGPPRDLAALALDLGYYDQAHMTHEFRELTDSTPQSFAARR
jgi:AraC-like DNA-binding protein